MSAVKRDNLIRNVLLKKGFSMKKLCYQVPNALCALLTISTASLFSADKTAPQDAPQKYVITAECNENLKKINQDYGHVLFYFKGVFKSAAECAKPDTTPSQLLALFQTEKSSINTTIEKNFMPASNYVTLVSKHNTELDEAFKNAVSHQSTQSAGNETNPWHIVHTLFEQKLKEVCIQYKTALVEKDAETLNFAKLGIFFTGNTVIINPDLATKTTIKKD